MENLVPIGQFAAASQLTLKALRLYAENGLLEPEYVDPSSGYRYYALRQLRTANMIRLLRAAGMPLAQVAGFLADPSQRRLDEYAAELGRELAERRRVLAYIARILDPKEEEMHEVSVKDVPAQRYASRAARVRVDRLDRFIADAIAELSPRGEVVGAPFALYHGEVNEVDDGPVEVCVPLADGDRDLPAGTVAFTHARGDQCRFPEILGAYEAVATWAKQHGHELAGPPREIYLKGLDEEQEPVLEIAWPVR